MLGLKTGISKGFGGASLRNISAQSLQYLSRLVPYPTSAREKAYCDFIDGLVNAGLGDHFDFLSINCAVNGGTSLTNVWGTQYTAIEIELTSGLTFSANSGWSGGVSGHHISTQFNPAIAISPKYTLNDAMAGFWCSSPTTIAAIQIFAATIANPQTPLAQLSLYPKWSNGNASFCINGASDLSTASPFNSDGLFIAQRTASNACALYRNNSLILSSSQSSSSVPNGEIRFRCAHPTRIMFIGKSMNSSQRASFQTLCENLITSITGGIP
jgi:hypothetical protein